MMGADAGAGKGNGTSTSTATEPRSGRYLTSLKGFSLERACTGLSSMASWSIQALRSAWSSARSAVKDGIKLFSHQWSRIAVVVKLDFTRWTVGFTWVDLRDSLPGNGTWWLFVYPLPCVAVMIGF